jgi:glycosyltransferase involved in cell wall biosynthesis
MSRSPLIFWQNMPSHHQVGALDRLGESWGAPVTCVWCEDVSPQRRAQGWPLKPRTNLKEVYLPKLDWRQAVDEVVASQGDSLHIISGIGAYPQLSHALRGIERLPSSRYAVMAESPVLLGWRAPLRRLKSALGYWPRRNRMLGLLAMGKMAADYYAGVGIPKERIYTFAYQSPYDLRTIECPIHWNRFVYFGQLEPRKGVDLLIRAVAKVKNRPFAVDIIGDGPARADLEALSSSLGVSDKVNFLGTLPSAGLQAKLSGYAFAVVPSRFDGWGMAVNESLQAGIPVLASDRVGAAELVRYSGAGAIYPADSVEALAEQIGKRIGNQDLLTAERESARQYKDRLRPDVIGDYLKEALEHMLGARQIKPTPPWVV